MKVKYFDDTDTALIQFTDGEIEETREITENITIDLDNEGNLVSMTIEHAKKSANLHTFAFENISELVNAGS
jgi:uncharacterized protein YuzE